MSLDVIELTKDLVKIDSVSAGSNLPVADRFETILRERGFEVERLEYTDDNGVRKANIVGRKGAGTGGLAFCSHLDTVPGTGWDRDPWSPVVEGDRLIGLGACDMKGPLAATLVAADGIEASRLRRPVIIAASADEEVGMAGARQVANESALLKAAQPRYAIIAEPTRLAPVHAHKGFGAVEVTAHGVAAHTSTDRGTSANFLIAPFLAEMAELANRLKSDPRYQNPDFDPPTLGFNMVINDGGCRSNVTAAKTICLLSMRPMPNDRSTEVMNEIAERAQRHGLEVTVRKGAPFHTAPDSALVQTALELTGDRQSQVVPYGTEAGIYQAQAEAIILGPGDIAQAHTNGEWIELAQLHRAVEIYTGLIERLCL